MKSLSRFSGTASNRFNQALYAHDIRSDVAVESPYTGAVGLELELEGRNLPTRIGCSPINGCAWTYHEDGSLRGPGGARGGGAEYVLNQPCAEADVSKLVTNLFADLKKQGAEIINSTRCSTHVHINMRGFKLNQLASFVALWGTFEDVLANWCGGHRSGNHFALRLSDSHAALDRWVKAFIDGNFAFSREYRYLALNPACLRTFGSLEVRTMKGADNAEDVVVWVEALTRLRDLAKSDAYSNPQNMAATFSGYSPSAFAAEVFKGLTIADELQAATEALDEDFSNLIVKGFRRVQPVLYALPWGDIVDELAKPFVPDPFGSSKKKKAASFEELVNAAAEAPIRRLRIDPLPVWGQPEPEPARPDRDALLRRISNDRGRRMAGRPDRFIMRDGQATINPAREEWDNGEQLFRAGEDRQLAELGG